MTKKDKLLLLRELSLRLYYNVNVNIKPRQDGDLIGVYRKDSDNLPEAVIVENLTKANNDGTDFGRFNILPNCTRTVRPYLRPLSSMTEEENREVSVLLNYEFYVDHDYALIADDDRHRLNTGIHRLT